MRVWLDVTNVVYIQKLWKHPYTRRVECPASASVQRFRSQRACMCCVSNFLSHTESTTRVSLGSLCYSTGLLKRLRDFNAHSPVVGAQSLAYFDEIVVTVPLANARSAAGVEAVAEWLEAHMQPLAVKLNRKKSHMLFHSGTNVGTRTEEAWMTLECAPRAVTRAGVRSLGVPVGDPDSIRSTVCDVARREPAALFGGRLL